MLFFVVMIREVKALAVVVNEAAFSVQIRVRMPAYTIFLFQESNRRFGGRHAFKEFIYAEFALGKTAAVTAKLVVYIGLRYRKSG